MPTSRPSRAGAAAFVVAGLMLFGAQSAAASDVDTVSGECEMSGEIAFKDPLGAIPIETTFKDSAEGTCTGTVNGTFMEDERVLLTAKGSGLMSCGTTRAVSTGTMVFTRNTETKKDDVKVDYIAESQGGFGQIVTRLRGRVSGEGIAQVSFQGDQSTLEACERGEFYGGQYNMTGTSITPLQG